MLLPSLTPATLPSPLSLRADCRARHGGVRAVAVGRRGVMARLWGGAPGGDGGGIPEEGQVGRGQHPQRGEVQDRHRQDGAGVPHGPQSGLRAARSPTGAADSCWLLHLGRGGRHVHIRLGRRSDRGPGSAGNIGVPAPENDRRPREPGILQPQSAGRRVPRHARAVRRVSGFSRRARLPNDGGKRRDVPGIHTGGGGRYWAL
mmetsp:Transcript_62718/g.175273  ORF Transcript_62718/g.175273 Transcript_62718/m.175273 type:complete len:203 (-) Transcript_62718:622-1230(-)